MTPNDTFRLSTYTALVSACVCLGYSEWDLLPEAAVFAAAVVAVLVGLFFTESRFELSLASANRVGLCIGVVAVAWLAYQFLNQNSLIYTFPWPASLLPYLGPLLMVLIPAKMVRPKHEGDWWAMQGIGLAGAALASAMAEDPTIGILLAVYAICAAWAVTLFFVHRAAGWLAPVPGASPRSVARGVGSARGPGRGAVGWALVAVLLALPAFFLTPRSQFNRWEFVRQGFEVGYSGQETVDLNRVGDLRPSKDVAFHVEVAAGAELPPDQRWRGRGYSGYDKGVWQAADPSAPLAEDLSRVNRTGELPDLGPGAVDLVFSRNASNPPGDQILADPVTWRVGEALPIVTLEGRPRFGWHQGGNTAVQVHSSLSGGVPYRQRYRPPDAPDRDLGPPFELLSGQPESVVVARYLRRDQVPPGVAAWAAATLAELAAADPALAPAAEAVRKGGRVAAGDSERVAVALGAHLAGSGGYRYATRLVRLDKKADPVEEFLTRSKEGHCQRFAASLVLSLRSLGVPCQYVLGFKGWDEDPARPGALAVRQDHAHAWAEVLVPRPAPEGFPFVARPADGPAVAWHWRCVDPTPAGAALEADGPGDWLDSASDQGRAFFLDFIVGYNPERRRLAVAAARAWFAATGWRWLAGVGLLVAAALAAPRVRRQFRLAPSAPPRPTTGVAAYDDFRAALRSVGVEPGPGETPREFAARAGDWLGEIAPDFAGLPGSVTDAMQRERYAGESPDAGEAARLAGEVRRMVVALGRT